jgi:hypothetical protein
MCHEYWPSLGTFSTYGAVKVTCKAEVLEMRVFEVENTKHASSSSAVTTVRQFTLADWSSGTEFTNISTILLSFFYLFSKLLLNCF